MLKRDVHREQPDRAYVGDITYVPTRESWLYLSEFVNLCSRAVVGWSMSNRMTATLVTDSLQMAMWKRKPEVKWPPLSRQRNGFFKLCSDSGFQTQESWFATF